MDLQFILRQLLEQRDTLDNTIRALEELIREREVSLSGAGQLAKSGKTSGEFVCRWCRRAFNSERWSPVCELAECREKESALEQWRESGKTKRRGRAAAEENNRQK